MPHLIPNRDEKGVWSGIIRKQSHAAPGVGRQRRKFVREAMGFEGQKIACPVGCEARIFFPEEIEIFRWRIRIQFKSKAFPMVLKEGIIEECMAREFEQALVSFARQHVVLSEEA